MGRTRRSTAGLALLWLACLPAAPAGSHVVTLRAAPSISGGVMGVLIIYTNDISQPETNVFLGAIGQ